MVNDLPLVENWSVITTEALQDAWRAFINFIPNLLAAIIVFIIGWFIAIAIGKLISIILSRLRFNKLFDERGWREALDKAEIKVNPSEFIGAIFKWILVVVFLMISVEIVGLTEFAGLLGDLIGWLPNLIVAIAIFVVAVIITDILDKIVRASVEKIGVRYVGIVGAVIRWAIYIFAGFAILVQLGIAEELVQAIITGFIAMLALALGLAFGLGGQHAAARLIEDLREKISEK